MAAALVVGDGLAAFTGVGFDLQSDVGDLDRGLGGSDLESEIDALAGADGDGDVLGDGIRESGSAGRDGVDAGAQRRDFVVARFVCGRRRW